MPINKNAFIRYKILDKCFSDKYHKYFIEDLMEKVNAQLTNAGIKSISKKQIYDDIKFMKSSEGWEAPIKSYQDGKRKYLRYEFDFSIIETPITEMEVEQLETLITSLSRFQGIPMYSWIEELLTNLRYRFGLRGVEANFIGFEQNRDMKGLRFLSTLTNCVIKRQPILIDYHPFNKEVVKWTIHPYYLKQYNNRWYLLGYNSEFEDLSIVPLDRIENIEYSDTAFKRNMRFDFDAYFRDILGISIEKDKKIEHIRLKFSPQRLPYVISKPIHHSQIVENESEGIISLNLIPNKELISELIWFRDDVEILSPESLREEIKEIIAKMYQKYFDVKKDCTTSL
jgi:predicted DNA-binding transcriptional regulator YafY